MADRFARVARAVREQPWALLPSVFEAMLEVLELRMSGGHFTDDEIRARIGADKAPAQAVERVGPVAVLPLFGVMAQRMSLFMAISGGTSTELFGKAFDEAVADPEVQAIVLDIDSPGGSVFGTEELAQKVYRSRGSKPIVAVSDSSAASAAYYVGAQADEFVASPSSMVGSIGVVITHTDVSKAEDAQGVKTTVISIPAAKTEGHPYQPLNEEALQNKVAFLQPYYDMFVKAVARGRGVPVSAVREGYGGGRMLSAIPAREAGMVDRIETLSDVVARLSTPQGRRAVLSASLQHRPKEETTAQELPAAATAQESPLWRDVLHAELDCL